MMGASNLIILASTFSSIISISAAVPPPAPCAEIAYTDNQATNWQYITSIPIPNGVTNYRMSSASGLALNSRFPKGVKCDFKVQFGKNPSNNVPQMDQKVICEDKTSDYLFKFDYKDDGLFEKRFWQGTWDRGNCQKIGGNLELDATKITQIMIWQNMGRREEEVKHPTPNPEEPIVGTKPHHEKGRT